MTPKWALSPELNLFYQAFTYEQELSIIKVD